MRVRDYLLIDQIGSGSYATVYKAQHIESKKFFAIKKMKDMPRNDAQAVKNEIELLKRVRHKNIIHYETDFEEKRKWYIVFEYCGKGDLEHFKNKQGTIPQAITKNIFYSILEAVHVLHQNNIVHRDLKLANILINDDLEIKLADFGFSKDSQGHLMTSYCGTPLTMAPQILDRKQYDDRCDTWSLGVLLYQLIYGKPPFFPTPQFGPGIIGLTKAVMTSQPKFDQSIEISPQCKKIILRCLQKDMKNRPTVEQLMNDPWFSSGLKSMIRKDYFNQNFNDKTQAKNTGKTVINKAIHENLLQLLKKTHLTDSGIKINIKCLTQYYPQFQDIQLLYLLKVSQLMLNVQKILIMVQVEGKQFNIKINNIKKFQAHKENLKEYLSRQIKKRKPLGQSSINIQKQLVTFLTDKARDFLGVEEIQPDKAKMLYDLSCMCLGDYSKSQIIVTWGFDEQHNDLRESVNKWLEQITNDQVLQIANEEIISNEDIKLNWLVDHRFQLDPKDNLVTYLAKKVHKVIQISSKFVNQN